MITTALLLAEAYVPEIGVAALVGGLIIGIRFYGRRLERGTREHGRSRP